MSGTSLIEYTINRVHGTVHERYMNGTWCGTRYGTPLKIHKYLNTKIHKYLKSTQNENFELGPSIFHFHKIKNLNRPRVKTLLPAQFRGLVFCQYLSK
jgi:hypothetical protein